MPSAHVKNADELRGHARGVTAVVDAALPNLTSRRDLMPRHFAALSLARANRLLAGMFTLHDAGLQDVSGVLVRPIMETMIVGLYSLYGGGDAYDVIKGAYVKQLETLPNEGPINEAKQSILESWTDPTGRLNIATLTGEVAALLHSLDGGASSPESAKMLYDVGYRGESLLNIHAGIGAVVGHLAEGDESFGVSRVRSGHDDGTSSLISGAVYVVMLAYHVFKVFGLGTTRIEALWDQLTQVDLVIEREMD